MSSHSGAGVQLPPTARSRNRAKQRDHSGLSSLRGSRCDSHREFLVRLATLALLILLPACADRQVAGTVTGTGATSGLGNTTGESSGEGAGMSTSDGGRCSDQAAIEGCPCRPDGGCSPLHTCNPNVNFCVDDACPTGSETCFCTPGGSCESGLSCVIGFCVDLECPSGTAGCHCIPGDSCNFGLACRAGVCE